jgi:hypothetical protein
MTNAVEYLRLHDPVSNSRPTAQMVLVLATFVSALLP